MTDDMFLKSKTKRVGLLAPISRSFAGLLLMKRSCAALLLISDAARLPRLKRRSSRKMLVRLEVPVPGNCRSAVCNDRHGLPVAKG